MEIAGKERMKGGEREKKKLSLSIEDTSLGKRVNNAALHLAWRLRGAIAMATPISQSYL